MFSVQRLLPGLVPGLKWTVAWRGTVQLRASVEQKDEYAMYWCVVLAPLSRPSV